MIDDKIKTFITFDFLLIFLLLRVFTNSSACRCFGNLDHISVFLKTQYFSLTDVELLATMTTQINNPFFYVLCDNIPNENRLQSVKCQLKSLP